MFGFGKKELIEKGGEKKNIRKENSPTTDQPRGSTTKRTGQAVVDVELRRRRRRRRQAREEGKEERRNGGGRRSG